MDARGELGRQAMLREFEQEIAVDVICSQELQRQLPARTSRLQSLLHLNERMLCQEQIGRAIGDDKEAVDAVKAIGNERQQIDGRNIGPVQIFEEDDEWFRQRELSQQRRQL